jgi:hypothetical protein
LEERGDIDVKAKVGKTGGNDLLASVVSVLSHLHVFL